MGAHPCEDGITMAASRKAKRTSASGRVVRARAVKPVKVAAKPKKLAGKPKQVVATRTKKAAPTRKRMAAATTKQKLPLMDQALLKRLRGGADTASLSKIPIAEQSPEQDEEPTLDRRLLHSIRVRNILSFGPNSTELPLDNLNVLVGLNSSGKSNFIEVMRLLQALPNDISEPIQQGGGIEHWMHKVQQNTTPPDHESRRARAGEIDAILGFSFQSAGKPPATAKFRYNLEIAEGTRRDVKVQHEEFRYIQAGAAKRDKLIFRYRGKNVYEVFEPFTDEVQKPSVVEREDSQQEQSFFHRMQTSRDSSVTRVFSSQLDSMKIYGDWTVGRKSALRGRQSADEIDGRFREDLSNIAAVVSNVVQNTAIKDEIVREMARHTNWVEDISLAVGLGYADVFFREEGKLIPAKRMSDGALRLFFLLAVLCDPNPPPLICIEEPEIGVHADVIPALVELMERAAQRTQLIVTTHSEVLIDSLTHNPAALVICEQVNGQTEMSRLNIDDVLKLSMEPNVDRGLAWFWQRGYLGGTK